MFQYLIVFPFCRLLLYSFRLLNNDTTDAKSDRMPNLSLKRYEIIYITYTYKIEIINIFYKLVKAD